MRNHSITESDNPRRRQQDRLVIFVGNWSSSVLFPTLCVQTNQHHPKIIEPRRSEVNNDGQGQKGRKLITAHRYHFRRIDRYRILMIDANPIETCSWEDYVQRGIRNNHLKSKWLTRISSWLRGWNCTKPMLRRRSPSTSVKNKSLDTTVDIDSKRVENPCAVMSIADIQYSSRSKWYQMTCHTVPYPFHLRN